MENNKPNIGSIVSADLTIPNADTIRDFYAKVIGWEAENMAMKDNDGSYSDYVMKDSDGNWVSGVCHSRGSNLGLPPQWILYINVADVAASMESCKALGGKVLKEAKLADGTIQYALLQDPEGAVLAVMKA